ncbi:MAG: Uma2 family endonuclease, partial [Alphaproteobacteria bacterium]|nr:Uma2 family endonuclease [Alphaproteobacteria bacterium]
MSAGTALRRKRPAKRATYRDVLDAPAHMVAEVVEGALHLQPRPASRHTLAGSSLGVAIGSPFLWGRGGPGGWWILDEPELQ